MPETSQQKATEFLKLTRSVVRTLRHGPREMALAVSGFVLLGATTLLPKADPRLPESLQQIWSAFPLVLSAAGVVLLAWSIVRVWRTVTAPLPDPGAPKPPAIKGATSFGPHEGELFSRLGRDRELAQLRGWILDDRVPLVALMGESGVGKTSLLRSGLEYCLRDDVLNDDKVRVFYWEARPSDAAASLLRALGEWTDDGAPASLDELRAEDGRRRVVIVDQAEQLSPERHPEVFEALRRAAASPSSRTTWVVAFRREYMATWSDFVLDLPDADRQRLETLSLKRFPRDVAERVIAVLVEESRLPIDQKVVAEVVASVAEDGKVSPVDIGISLLALSEVTPGVRTYSIDRFRSTGGQTGLLVSYLERLLEGWGEKERSEVLRALLELVVLDDDRRMAEGGTLDELVDAVDPVQPERFRKRLDYLASPRARILERVPATAESGPLRLTHERLIPALRRLTGMLLAEPEQARLEMERLYVIWSRDRQRKYLLSGGPLRRTLRHQAQFRGLERDTDKQEFIWRSRRRRSLLRGAAVVGLVVLGIGGTSVASWVQVELHRTALESWNLPRDLYDYQKQLEELILPGAVHHLGWLKPGIKTLDLTATGITSLEGLPDSITSLDLRRTRITSLEGLPDSITSLDLRHTRITSLEGLPDSITSLGLSYTGITSLEGLPDSITSLDLSFTGITSVEGLPDSIIFLDLSGIGITSLEGLPDSITSLDLRQTGITSLERLPSKLQKLTLHVGQVRSLQGLPASVRVLHFLMHKSLPRRVR